MIELFCFLSYFLSVNIRSIRKCFITEMWQIVLMAGFKEVVQVGTLSYFFFQINLDCLMRIIVMLLIIGKGKEEMFF